MRSQLSVWCEQAVPVSGCGVGDYSSVMRWMVVGVVCVGRDVIAEHRPDHAGEQYIGHWMSANRLKLNADKTELL